MIVRGNIPEILWAKRARTYASLESARLGAHSLATLSAMEALLDSLDGELRAWLRLAETDFLRWRMAALAGGALHDIGKANDSMQALLGSKGMPSRQLLRHEFWSVLVLGDWLGDWWRSHLGEPWADMALAGVVAHHLKANNERIALATRDGMHAQFYWQAAEFAGILAAICERFDWRMPPLPDWTSIPGEKLDDALRSFTNSCARRLNKTHKRALGAMRALIVAADRVASATMGPADLSVWVRDAIGQRLGSEKLAALLAESLGKEQLRQFQTDLLRSTSQVTIVCAGCGNGKTTGAIAWAQLHALRQKLVFAYPTTGTASEGFKNYADGIPGIAAVLRHGRANIDLGETTLTGEEDASDSAAERVAILNEWNADVIVCTVDQVLGLLQNSAAALTLFPALLCSAFVFDEIHTYDDTLFANLLTFLREFDHAPVLLMTASLPPAMRATLEEVIGPLDAPIRGDAALERQPRYQIEFNEKDGALADAINEYRSGGRVLWVCNTIERCLAVYRLLKEQADISALVYHSRFKYFDRIERQRDAINAFQRGFRAGVPAFAITTQICEVSFDISATLLVTDACPFAAFVQRLGRLNRPGQELPIAARALVLSFQGKPYETTELEESARILRRLAGRPVSQSDLALALEEVRKKVVAPVSSAWLATDWRTEQSAIRDAGYTIDVLLASDRERLDPSVRSAYTELKRYLIPMIPNRRGDLVRDSRFHVYVAPDDCIDYNPLLGATWR